MLFERKMIYEISTGVYNAGYILLAGKRNVFELVLNFRPCHCLSFRDTKRNYYHRENNFGQSTYIYICVCACIYTYIYIPLFSYIYPFLFTHSFIHLFLRVIVTLLANDSFSQFLHDAWSFCIWQKKKKDSVYIYIVRTTDKHSYKHRNTQNTQEEIRLSMKKIVETKKKKR